MPVPVHNSGALVAQKTVSEFSVQYRKPGKPIPIPLPTTLLPNNSPPHPSIQSPPTPLIQSLPTPPIQSPPTPLMQSTPTPLNYSSPTPVIQFPPNPPIQSPLTLMDHSHFGEEPSTGREVSTRYPSPIPVEEVSMDRMNECILKYEIISESTIKDRSTLLDGLGYRYF